MKKIVQTIAIVLLVAIIYCGFASFSFASMRYWKKTTAHTPSNKGVTSFYPFGSVTASRQIMILLHSTSPCDVEKGARALGRFKGDIAPEILQICKKGDYGLPGPVLTYIVDYCGIEGLEFVNEVLKDKNRESSIRAKAAFALGRKRYKKALPDILMACRSRDWILRSAASRAIGIIGSHDCLPILSKLFTMEKDNRVLPEMAQALFRLGSDLGIPWLISAYKDRHCKGIPGEDSRMKLIITASEWPRYRRLMKVSETKQDLLLENWIYEWEHGSLPPLGKNHL